jgi:short-subunit dehydrogenase
METAMSSTTTRKFAVVTGASSGIGFELAKQFAANQFDVLIAADEGLDGAAQKLNGTGEYGEITSIKADLSTREGVGVLYDAILQTGRPVDALAANAGIGHGHAFLDQSREDWMRIIDTNIIGTLDLLYLVGKDMRKAGSGRILITSSIASQLPGAFQAVYNASKAFLQSFSFALRNELKDSGVSVTALLPGATETEFFDRADMKDTKVGQAKKDDPADVAAAGYEALMDGRGDVVYGLKNKLQVAAAKIIPDDRLAESHRNMAEPGTGKNAS